MKTPVLITALLSLSISVFGQKMQTPAGEAPGPWILGTIGVGPQPSQVKKIAGAEPSAEMPPGSQIALKGFVVKVGEHGEAAVAYDLDLCRMIGAWSGKFVTPMNLMSRGEYPTAMGEVAFTTGETPGFLNSEGRAPAPPTSAAGAKAEDSTPAPTAPPPSPAPESGTRGSASRRWQDPRAEPFGPLPPGQARFRGFYVNGDKTILKWDIGGVEVLEMPGYQIVEGSGLFIRTLRVPPSNRAVVISVCPVHPNLRKEIEAGTANLDGIFLNKTWFKEAVAEGKIADADIAVADLGSDMILARCDSDGIRPLWSLRDDQLWVEIPPQKVATTLRLALSAGAEKNVFEGGSKALISLPKAVGPLPDLAKGSGARWPEPVVSTGELSKDTESAYVVDTIKLPDPNPWGAPMFVGGFDFFERVEGTAPSVPRPAASGGPASLRGIDGAMPSKPVWDAAVCTFHGDVFLVSGLDEKLEKVTWKRFASGLYHALGLKIVNGEIYVTCRDGIWRLKDLNGDGEADFYEAFNFDVKVTKSFHEFVFDLQTDPAGNFYFAKAGPVKNGGRGFDEIMAHHGSLFRVSPDGKKFDVIATGFRAPNGIGVGPHGELTSGDNEGTWTPVCKINWITPGGFYGVVPLAHRDPLPTSYDPPLCWLPKRVDNSSGSQVWAPEGERWGPWGGKMLHLSYGQAALYGVLMEEIGNRPSAIGNAPMQGGVTKFPLQFQSGIMRARFSPTDSQLYVAGLRGWQTSGLKNGCFQRVRYTGAETRMPIELHVKKDGIELRFTASLDTQSARDPENWHLEQWRYLWSAAYGSPELSTETDPEAPAETGKDGAAQFTKAQMSQAKHDSVSVKSVTIGTDDRTVFLEIPGLKPVMQMSIKYDLKTAEGKDLRGEVVSTIHALGTE